MIQQAKRNKLLYSCDRAFLAGIGFISWISLIFVYIPPSIYESCIHSFIHSTLTAEGFIPPGSNVDPTVLAFIDIGFNGFTQNRLGSIQLTQIKNTVLEVILKTHIQFVELQFLILSAVLKYCLVNKNESKLGITKTT